MSDIDRAHRKMDAFWAAWSAAFGSPPAVATVVLGCGVAEHETRCGDAWAVDFNWGACTKGALSPAQKAVLATKGIHAGAFHAPPGTPPAQVAAIERANRAALEAQATQALVDAGLPLHPDQAVHIDSSPQAGWYFTTFGKFSNDVDGALYFVHVIAAQRPFCKAALVAGGSPEQLAAAMYHSKYFTGFHKSADATPEAKEAADAANIADYVKGICSSMAAFTQAAPSWTPAPPAPAPTLDEPIDAGALEAAQAASLMMASDPTRG